MSVIFAGRFQTQAEADRAKEALRRAGFRSDEVSSFYLNPAGQHAIYPLGGDAHHDEGTKDSGKTAVAGGAIGGAAGVALGTVAAAASEPGFTAVLRWRVPALARMSVRSLGQWRARMRAIRSRRVPPSLWSAQPA